MSARKKAAQKKTPPAASTKKKGTAPPKSRTTAAIHERAIEIEQLRERAVILEALAEVCLEFFTQAECEQPKYLVRRIDGSSSAADFDVAFTVSHELIVAAGVARARARDLLDAAALVAPVPLPSLSGKEPPHSDLPPGERWEGITPNPLLSTKR